MTIRMLGVMLAISTVAISVVACNRDHDAVTTTSAHATSAASAPASVPAAAEKPAASVFSCDRRKSLDEYDADTCIDFSQDSVQQGEAYMRKPCSDPVSVFAHAACPKDKLVATCESRYGKNLFRYYSGGKMGFTAESAKAQCTEMYGGKIL